MIILARMENSGLKQTGRIVERDRNLFNEVEEVPEAHALLFCRKELKGDLERAAKLAAEEGYKIYTNFPKGTRVKAAFEIAKKRVEKESEK